LAVASKASPIRPKSPQVTPYAPSSFTSANT
jgi:hypothetical protein